MSAARTRSWRKKNKKTKKPNKKTKHRSETRVVFSAFFLTFLYAALIFQPPLPAPRHPQRGSSSLVASRRVGFAAQRAGHVVHRVRPVVLVLAVKVRAFATSQRNFQFVPPASSSPPPPPTNVRLAYVPRNWTPTLDRPPRRPIRSHNRRSSGISRNYCHKYEVDVDRFKSKSIKS